MAVKPLADVTVAVSIDKQQVANDIKTTLNDVQSDLNKNVLTYKITGDPSDVEKIIQDLQERKIKVGSSIHFTTNLDDFNKEFAAFQSLANKSVKTITSSLKKNMSNSLQDIGIKQLFQDVLGDNLNLSKSNVIKLVDNLKAQVSDFSLDGASYNDITKTIKAYERLKIVRDEMASKPIRGIEQDNEIISNILGMDMLDKDLNKFYSSASKYIHDNYETLNQSLIQDFEKVRQSVTDIVKSLSSAFDGSSVDVSGTTKAFENMNKELQKAEDKLSRLENALPNTFKKIQKLTTQLTSGKISEEQYEDILDDGEKGLLLNYQKLGGKRENLPTQAQEFWDNMGYEEIPDKEYQKKITTQRETVEKLRTSVQELQNEIVETGAAVQNTATQIDGTSFIDNEELQRANQLIEEQKVKIEELTRDYENAISEKAEYKWSLDDIGKQLSDTEDKNLGLQKQVDELLQLKEAYGALSDEYNSLLDSYIQQLDYTRYLDNELSQLKETCIQLKSELQSLRDNGLNGADTSNIFSKEIEDVKELTSQINEVKLAVDEKTDAFTYEGDTVKLIIDNEINYIDELIKDINNAKKLLNEITDIDVSLKTGDIDTAQLSNLKESVDFFSPEKLSNISQSIAQLQKSITKFSDSYGLKSLDLSKLTRLANNSDNYQKFAGSLLDIAIALSEIQKTGLKKNTSTNIELLGDGLTKLSKSLTGFSEDAKTSLSYLNAFLNKSDEIKSLSSILNNSSKLGKVKESIENNGLNEQLEKERKTADLVSKSFDSLTKKIVKYYSLSEKSKAKTLTSKEAVDFTKLQQTFEAAKTIDFTNNNFDSKEISLIFGKGFNVNDLTENIRKFATKAKEIFISEFNSQWNVLAKNRVDGLSNLVEQYRPQDKQQYTQKYVKIFNDLESKVKQLNDKLPIDNVVDPKAIQEIKDLIKSLNTNANSKIATSLSKTELIKDYAMWMSKNTAATFQFGTEIKNVGVSIKELGDNANASETEVKKLRDEFNILKANVAKSGATGLSMFDQWKVKMKDLFAYLTSFVGFYDIINMSRTGLNVVKEYNGTLTEMKKVSDDNISTLKQFQSESFNLGRQVGTTGKQIQESTADFLRIGENLQQAQNSAQVSNILLNVSEFENIEDTTDSVIAMSQAYSELDKMEIIDKLNNVGNNFSISTDGLSRGLQRAAATLKTQGNNINEAIALITTGNSIIQDPEQVAAGVRTISLRIAGTEVAKDELQSLGEDIDDFVVQTQSKTDETIKNLTAVASNGYKGVSVLDNNGNLKNTFEILRDISEVYKEIQELDKQTGRNAAPALVEYLAGKNRSNIASSILLNPELLEKVYTASQNSSGSAQEELDSYLDSVSGRLEQLQNQAEEFWFKLLDSETLKVLINGGSKLLELLDNFVNTFGSLKIAAVTLGAIMTKKGLGKIALCPPLEGYIIMPYNQPTGVPYGIGLCK